MEFNPFDGKLYVTVGDNNVSDETAKFYNDPTNAPQVLTDLRGKTLRLNLDGSIPADNPFVGRADANPAVYTYGHRNPYSMNVDAPTGNVYVGEVGYDRKEDYEENQLAASRRQLRLAALHRPEPRHLRRPVPDSRCRPAVDFLEP